MHNYSDILIIITTLFVGKFLQIIQIDKLIAELDVLKNAANVKFNMILLMNFNFKNYKLKCYFNDDVYLWSSNIPYIKKYIYSNDLRQNHGNSLYF